MPQAPHQTAFRFTSRLTGLALALAVAGCTGPGQSPAASANPELSATPLTVVPFEEVDWGALNPARGDAGPRAADLWGNRATTDATGFLVRFTDGFSSPPHIHNVTYRGVVISGLVHNDDPGAEESWMPPGSYWTQPAGEVHITSAKGEGRVAYIEIQHGPYLVMPPEEATDNGERAINVHAGNLVWLDASTTRQISLSPNVAAADGPRIAFLWGDPQDARASGALVELPAGQTSTLKSSGTDLRVVVITGEPQLRTAGGREPLSPGSFVGAPSVSGAAITWTTTESSWLYVRSSAPIEVAARPSN